MKNITKAIILTGTMIGSYYVGTLSNPNLEYKLIQKNEQQYIHAKKIKKTYELKNINNETYLGNAEHNLKGAKELLRKELTQTNNPDLEQRINREENQKIHEKIKQEIQRTYQEIKNWYKEKTK